MKKHWKRALSLALAMILTLGLGVTAFAESESLDSQLARVTQQVKQTLGLNTDEYTEFYGDRYDQPGGPVWYLNWYSDNGNLSINVLGDTITSYYRYSNRVGNSFFYGFNTAYPAHSKAEAQAAAQAFLNKVLAKNESADFTYSSASLGSNPGYYFNGTIQKNGLDTPISFYISVNGSDLEVNSFNRSNEYNLYLSGDLDLPGAATTDAAGALGLLRDTVDFELIWVLGDDGEARLTYVPQTGNYVVDALSGELVDLDALYAQVARGGYNYSFTAAAEAAAEPEAAMDAGARLTDAEQNAVSNLEGVIPASELDAFLRSIDALGLTDDFSMTSRYQTNQQTGDVSCTLRYSCLMDRDHTFGYDPAEIEQYLSWGDAAYYNKNIQVDAKTGQIKSINAWAYVGDYAAEGLLEDEAMQATAASFLAEYGTEAAKAMEVYDVGDNSFQFAQTEAGYFFPENSATVGVNPVTGTIERLFYITPETEVTFGPATGLIDSAAALEAYLAAGETRLCYVAWPVAITSEDPVLYAYADYGYSFVERLALVYALRFDSYVQGIDAVTGQVNTWDSYTDNQLHYTDLEGAYGAYAIEALAQVGIGWSDEQFRPTDTITQRELAQLLLGTAYGTVVDGYDDDSLKQDAGYYGFISAEGWNPEAPVTRMEMLKAILNASEYGKAAALSGAYYCSFNDESGVQPQDYGYVSIGQALGVVHGTPEGYFNAYGPCTRQDAAIMVYNFLNR